MGMHHRRAARCLGVSAVVLLTACSTSAPADALAQDSSCADYVASDSETRYDAVLRISAEIDAPYAGNPMLGPKTDTVCASRDDWTIAQALGVGRPGATDSAAEPESAEPIEPIEAEGPEEPEEPVEEDVEESSGQSDTAAEIEFEVTTAEGWHYKASVPLPEVTFTATKDISSSPPGEARLDISVVDIESLGYARNLQGSTVSLPPDNPGREGGPQAEVNVAYLQSLPPQVEQLEDLFIGGTCGFFEPVESDLTCTNQPGLTYGGAKYSYTGDESIVDAAIAGFVQNRRYLVSFEGESWRCESIVDADAQTTDMSRGEECGGPFTTATDFG